MSIVEDQVRRYDSLLDRYAVALGASQTVTSTNDEVDTSTLLSRSAGDTATVTRLKTTIRSLSTASNPHPLLKRKRLRHLIKDLAKSQHGVQTESEHTEELLWLATGKATIQLYGIVLGSFLEQTIPLSDSIWYWDDVLGSYVKRGLYMLQTSPIRFWNASKEVYREASARYETKFTIREAAAQSRQGLTDGWRQFYGLVRDSIHDRSLVQARTRALSPFALSRAEARQKQENIRRLREQSATAIGLLVDEGLTLPVLESEGQLNNVDWKSVVGRGVAILESILQHSQGVDGSTTDYEFRVIDGFNTADYNVQANHLVKRLLHILDDHLPAQERSSLQMFSQYGMPSRLVRYWIPGILLLLSGGTLLRILTNRKAEIRQWIYELGDTGVDFWHNWVVEPARKLLGTIRHDEDSDIALMSRESLKSDRDSLERMVVDFAIKHPENNTAYSQAQIDDIRNKVRAGDLTPVLRVYEEDIKSPIVKSISGDLVQSLLIQVQKTKVDVEVAIGGIDSLLKSQELLFGFVGLAPGILVSYFLAQWLRGVLGGRRSIESLKTKGDSIRLLRNIDRTLTNAMPTENNMLSFKDHGLLICEASVLRQRVTAVLPGSIQREFLEDLNDLLDVRSGVGKQIQVVERIHWAYSQWLR